jgi:hypothetical protein
MSTAPIWLLYSLKVETEAALGAWLDQSPEALDNWNKKNA